MTLPIASAAICALLAVVGCEWSVDKGMKRVLLRAKSVPGEPVCIDIERPTEFQGRVCVRYEVP